jgi:D-glycero-alpha-D-manno-heptose-7-phosphate kinase
MIITKTPYRLSLFGGGTDYPTWYNKHPSKCLSAAMAHYCYVHVKQLPPFFDHKIRLAYSKLENINSIDDIEHPSIRECLRHTNFKENISISHDGDLPARSGIGSSSSFTVGLLNALFCLKGQYLPKKELSQKAIFVEQNLIGESVGIQDQIMAAYGGIRLINMSIDGWDSEEFKMSPNYKSHLESHIMLGFSGVSRYSEIQAKKKVDNIKEGTTEKLLLEMIDSTNEAITMLCKEKEMSVIGELLDISWNIKRSLADGVTQKWIDNIYFSAIENGALGGKLMGAGGGGFFMFLVTPELQDHFKNSMKEIKVWVPFKFDNDGSQIILNNM